MCSDVEEDILKQGIGDYGIHVRNLDVSLGMHWKIMDVVSNRALRRNIDEQVDK